MLRKAALFSLLTLAACSPSGKFENPFEKKPAFQPTPVPADFAVVVDENHDTYQARQHIQQVITAADAMSRTTYAYYRDYNDVVSRKFSQEVPLSPQQLQDMWNAVSREELMIGSAPFINWRSDADMYRRNAYTLQIRANGQSKSYRATNGFSGQTRPLMLLVEAVRLPISQNTKTPALPAPGVPGAAPESAPTVPESAPATPTTTPAGGSPMVPEPTIELVPAATTAPATQP